jgi:hypothetical protein
MKGELDLVFSAPAREQIERFMAQVPTDHVLALVLYGN